MHGIPQLQMKFQLLAPLLLWCTIEVAALDDLKTVLDFSIDNTQNPTRNEFGHFVPKFDSTKHKYIQPNYHIGEVGVYTPLAAISKNTPAEAQCIRLRKTHSSKKKFKILSAQISATRTDLLWPDATILFKWHKDIEMESKTQFQIAMKILTQLSSVRFRQVSGARNSESSFVILRSDQGCGSDMFYNGPHSPPSSSSSNSKCSYHATYIHELLHVFGMDHTQAFMYRDDFVKVLEENIIDSDHVRENFQKSIGPEFDDPGRDNAVYAYDSIMHYSRQAFSVNGKDTIQTLDPRFQDVIGQKEAISPSDIINLEKMYSNRARYRYEKVPNNSNEIMRTVAIYTDVRGEERVVPSSGYFWTKPGAKLPFLFASNSRRYWIFIAGESGKMYTHTTTGSTNSIRCQQHSPLGHICFERRTFDLM